MTAYYNEIDPFAAQWLRNLIAAGHIAPGEVDTRSVADVTATDLDGYTQCHFFAGLGGWSHALRLAEWPDDRPIWTGSCPCQPFSAAGKGHGADDPRHLWPTWFRLIRECRPSVVAGEQVAAAIGHGWLDLVCTDLEAEGYAVGAVVLPAASVGAPHKRDRCWFVADTEDNGVGTLDGKPVPGDERQGTIGRHGVSGVVGHTNQPGPQGRIVRLGTEPDQRLAGASGVDGTREPWRYLDWLPCRDGKTRPTQPGLFPLAHGIPGRVGRLRAYGNAIVPQVAAEVLKAYMATRYTPPLDKPGT